MNVVRKSLLPFALVLVAPLASANTGLVTFQGDVTAATCTVANGPSFTVKLPRVSEQQLTPGNTVGRTRFPMQLTGCSAVDNGVRAFFEAGPNVDPAFHTVRPDNGGPVHFAMYDADGSRMDVGTVYQGITKYASNETMYYEVAYHRVSADPLTPGQFEGSVTYSLKYE